MRHGDQVKRQLAASPQRDPRKATKDMLQAELVEQMVPQYLPHLGNKLEVDGDASPEPSQPEPITRRRGRTRRA